MKHLNQLCIDQNAQHASHEAELRRVNRNLEKIVDASVSGVAVNTIKEHSLKLEGHHLLEEILSSSEQAPVLVHPNMAHRYAVEVNNLIQSLNDEEHRREAGELLRKCARRFFDTKCQKILPFY